MSELVRGGVTKVGLMCVCVRVEICSEGVSRCVCVFGK